MKKMVNMNNLIRKSYINNSVIEDNTEHKNMIIFIYILVCNTKQVNIICFFDENRMN